MQLCNFVFKPNNIEIAKKVIEAFGDQWLNWDDSCAYAEWSHHGMKNGYINLTIESEGVNTDEYTETCYHDLPVTSHDLTEHMMIVLDQAGAFDAPWLNERYDKKTAEEDSRVVGYGTDNPKYYCFEDVELSDIIAYLQANNSRSLSFWGTTVWICEKNHIGETKCTANNLIQYALNVPIFEKTA